MDSSENKQDIIMLEENSDQEQQTKKDEKAAKSNSKSAPSTPSNEKKQPKNNQLVEASAEKLLKQQQKLELAKKRQEEKEKKEREKKEREEQKLKREEEQRKKKEEEEQLRQKRLEEKEKQKQERLEKERERQEQINLRNEEKRKRDEEKKKLEEEKKKLEEEKLREKQREEEEKKRKEEKVKTYFANYFIKKETNQSQSLLDNKDEHKSYRFMQFQLKENMHLAPICRRNDFINMDCEQKEEFIQNMVKLIFNTEENELKDSIYLKEIQQNALEIRRQYKPTKRGRSQKTNIKSNNNNEINKIDEASNDDIKFISSGSLPTNNMTKFRVKYLHFDPKVYRRPPYYGTWKKKSNLIKPRNPFAKDEKIIDYEVDSDDEWEDEADGESIADSDKADTEEDPVKGDDEDDDGFFVPHGHLSDDELDEEERNLDPETKQAREAAKSEQWETERKKTSKHLVPKCFYSVEYWNVPDNLDLDSARPELKHLHKFQIVPLIPSFPIDLNKLVFQPQKSNEELTGKSNKAETSNMSSPNVNGGRSKSNKQKGNVSATQSPSSNSTPNNNKGSIIKFISKISNKTCNLEQINSTATTNPSLNNNSTNKPATTSTTKNDLDVIIETIDLVAKNTTTPSAKLRKENSTAILNKGSPSTTTTPLNGKNSNATCSTAEKRAHNEENDNVVKRLKLDDSNVDSAKVNAKSTASPTILSFFKNSSSSCRKNLRLSNCEIDSTLPEESNLSETTTEINNKCSKTKSNDTSNTLSPKKVSNNLIKHSNLIEINEKLVKSDIKMDTSESVNKENNEHSTMITID